MNKLIIIVFGLAIYFFAPVQDMKGMDMTKKENIQQVPLTTYTCVIIPKSTPPNPATVQNV